MGTDADRCEEARMQDVDDRLDRRGVTCEDCGHRWVPGGRSCPQCGGAIAADDGPLAPLTKVVFADKPDDYPAQPQSASSMVDAPERLLVALHRHAQGVYEILGADGRGSYGHPQESLWRVVTYHRVSHVPGLAATYSVTPPAGSACPHPAPGENVVGTEHDD